MSSTQEAPNLDRLGVLDEHGHRRHVYPADVSGRFSRFKPWVYTILIVIYAVMPWVEVGGHPAILIDIPTRRFYLLGNTYNAQDFYLAFFFLTGIGFSLIVLSALFGRVWCGWACPQTVFLEGVFRRLERWIEGPRQKRMGMDHTPWTAEIFARKVAKHALYLVLAFVIAHIFLSYFVSLPRLFEMMRLSPVEHWTAFLWAFAMTAIIYFNFFWFREQTCIVLCPYGRLQSALQDRDTFIIGYDKKRGEPRGKVGATGAGDCIDCKRCVVVCPTGIDIRNGLQLECVGCAACIDACDEMMTRVGRPTGLVRYDSERGLVEGVRRFWRPRVLYYVVAGLVGLTVATTFFLRHTHFEANVLRQPGMPYVIEGETIRNSLSIHLVNKNATTSTLSLSSPEVEGVQLLIAQPQVTLESLDDLTVPLVVTINKDHFKAGMKLYVTVADQVSGERREVPLTLLGPGGRS